MSKKKKSENERSARWEDCQWTTYRSGRVPFLIGPRVAYQDSSHKQLIHLSHMMAKENAMCPPSTGVMEGPDDLFT